MCGVLGYEWREKTLKTGSTSLLSLSAIITNHNQSRPVHSLVVWCKRFVKKRTHLYNRESNSCQHKIAMYLCCSKWCQKLQIFSSVIGGGNHKLSISIQQHNSVQLRLNNQRTAHQPITKWNRQPIQQKAFSDCWWITRGLTNKALNPIKESFLLKMM